MKCLFRVFFLCLASMTSAQDSIRLLPAPIELPARIGPLQFDGNPHKYEPAALGVSYQYNGAGLSLTIYVYDAGVTNIPDGGDTVLNCHLFEQTKLEVGAAGYSDLRLVSQQLVRLSPPDDAPLAREAVFEFVRGGEPTISYVWLTSIAKHFVKVRFSMGEDQRHEAQEARRFLLNALGAAVKPHLSLADPDAKVSEVTLNLFAGANTEEMATGIMYLAMLQTRMDATPGSRPLCGGEFIPPYDTELSIFQTLLALNLDGTAGRFGKQLAAVSTAGFLDEFVWVELHRNAWGDATPDGLMLAEYQVWKKKNLKRFKRPQLGALIVNQPRPMEVEAPDAP